MLKIDENWIDFVAEYEPNESWCCHVDISNKYCSVIYKMR